MTDSTDTFNAAQAREILDAGNSITFYEMLNSILESVKRNAAMQSQTTKDMFYATSSNNDVAQKVVTELQNRGFTASIESGLDSSRFFVITNF